METKPKRAKTEAANSTDALSFVSDICGTLKKLKRTWQVLLRFFFGRIFVWPSLPVWPPPVRTGWVMRKVPLPESDSDHMHRCAMCAMLLTQPPDPRDDYSGAERFHPDKVQKGHTDLDRFGNICACIHMRMYIYIYSI